MVTNISCHPTRDMIASGDINGVVRLYVTFLVVIFCVLGEEVLVVGEPNISGCIVISSECASLIYECYPITFSWFVILAICFVTA